MLLYYTNKRSVFMENRMTWKRVLYSGKKRNGYVISLTKDMIRQSGILGLGEIDVELHERGLLIVSRGHEWDDDRPVIELNDIDGRFDEIKSLIKASSSGRTLFMGKQSLQKADMVNAAAVRVQYPKGGGMFITKHENGIDLGKTNVEKKTDREREDKRIANEKAAGYRSWCEQTWPEEFTDSFGNVHLDADAMQHFYKAIKNGVGGLPPDEVNRRMIAYSRFGFQS